MKNTLLDKDGKTIAEIEVKSIKGNLLSGNITSHSLSEGQIIILKEYEDLVNNQVFSHLEKHEEKIDSWDLKLKEKNKRIFDLQIWDLREISFRILE